MRARFTQSFKIQAVEKVLSRSEETSIEDVAKSLGVGYSTLQKWMVQSRNHELELKTDLMTKEKRPQDWNLEEKLDIVIACGSLDETGINTLCREKGLYPHHLRQWKKDFTHGTTGSDKNSGQVQAKQLKQENKDLKKELRRKEKALAETAALLVLQKKVNAIWGNDEDSSQ